MVIGEKIHFKPLKNVTVHGYRIRPEKQVCFSNKLKLYLTYIRLAHSMVKFQFFYFRLGESLFQMDFVMSAVVLTQRESIKILMATSSARDFSLNVSTCQKHRFLRSSSTTAKDHPRPTRNQYNPWADSESR